MIALQIWPCAAEQGLGEAAENLAINLSIDHRFPEAVAAFQQGVRAGDSQSALNLERGFTGLPPSDQLNYLALPNDPERTPRRKLIGNYIDRNDGRNPTVPGVDKIVPLPPAKLSPWDGSFEWEKQQATATPPQKPSDGLIERLSNEKHLDPATGLPLSGGTVTAPGA